MMNSTKSWLLEQFPNYEEHIHRLWGVDQGFESKSHEYFELQSKINNLDHTAEPDELQRLNCRRNALQSELMFFMGANQR